MKLNFTNDFYKEKALNIKSNPDIHSMHSNEEAFLILIKDLEFKDLDNFCSYLEEKYSSNLSAKDYHNMLISENIPDLVKLDLIDSLYECLSIYQNLGSNTIADGKINTSSWLSHSIYEAKLASVLAAKVNLDSDVAFQMGLLHDVGRKKTHTFEHVTRGFEYLIDKGWEDLSLCTLTHSFLMELTNNVNKGGRFANCDPAEDGFYVDEQLLPHYEDNFEKDDLAEFLQNYDYSMYDMILNISDLMATDKGVVSPYDRVKDVATRKAPDVRNRAYFLNNFCLTLLRYLNIAGLIENYDFNISDDLSVLEENLRNISDLFYSYYLSRDSKNFTK